MDKDLDQLQLWVTSDAFRIRGFGDVEGYLLCGRI